MNVLSHKEEQDEASTLGGFLTKNFKKMVDDASDFTLTPTPNENTPHIQDLLSDWKWNKVQNNNNSTPLVELKEDNLFQFSSISNQITKLKENTFPGSQPNNQSSLFNQTIPPITSPRLTGLLDGSLTDFISTTYKNKKISLPFGPKPTDGPDKEDVVQLQSANDVNLLMDEPLLPNLENNVLLSNGHSNQRTAPVIIPTLTVNEEVDLLDFQPIVDNTNNILTDNSAPTKPNLENSLESHLSLSNSSSPFQSNIVKFDPMYDQNPISKPSTTDKDQGLVDLEKNVPPSKSLSNQPNKDIVISSSNGNLPITRSLSPSIASSEGASINKRMSPKSIITPTQRRRSCCSHDRRVRFNLPDNPSPLRVKNTLMYNYGSKGSNRYPSVSDLEQLYLKKCVSLKIRPQRRLLGQLESAGEQDIQLRSIDLSGTPNMVLADWEAVCEVIRNNVFLKSLKADNCSLDDQSLKLLGPALCRYNVIEVLNIATRNMISSHGIDALSPVFSACRNFRELNLSGIKLTKKTAQLICTSLVQGTIQTLILNNCGLNDLKVLGIIAVGIPRANSIQTLSLQSNGIEQNGAKLLSAMLQSSHCHIGSLDLCSNSLQDQGCAYLAQGLSHNMNLKTLLLWRNRIGSPGLIKLCKALETNKVLSTLDISYNDCCDQSGMDHLRDCLLSNSSIHTLNMVFSGLEGDGLISLAEAVAMNKSVTNLDLRHNPRNAAGLMALERACRVNKSLVIILIDPIESQDDDITKEMWLSIVSSTQRNAESISTDEVVYNATTPFHHRFMGDLPSTKNPINIKVVKDILTLLKQMLDCYENSNESIDEGGSLQILLDDLMNTHVSIQLACQEETEEDKLSKELDAIIGLVTLLVLNDEITKTMEHYNKLKERPTPTLLA